MYGPQLGVRGQLRVTDEFVASSAEVVTTVYVADRPSTVLIVRYGHLEHAVVVTFLLFTEHVPVLPEEGKNRSISVAVLLYEGSLWLQYVPLTYTLRTPYVSKGTIKLLRNQLQFFL